MKVRVRFAPSPTGHLHIGGARTALYNFLFAQAAKGTLILRIEDTDLARSEKKYEQELIKELAWLGLTFDEGPEIGGAYGPYRQSERGEIYSRSAWELVEKAMAYPCFLSNKELDELTERAKEEKKAPHIYHGKYRDYPLAEAKRRIAEGEEYVIRFKNPDCKYSFADLVRGVVSFPEDMVGDFVIIRSSGMPVYNFCCVVDDALMKITHVIRAEDHLNNTVRQLMLYEALGYEIPIFAHVSLLVGEDRQKLSKRHGATSVTQYFDEGFLPQALTNYLCLLGWSHPEEKDIFNVNELGDQFNLERFNKSPALYDVQKLKYFNEQHLRGLSPEKLIQGFSQSIAPEHPFHQQSKVWKEKFCGLFVEKVQLFSDINAFLPIIFQNPIDSDDQYSEAMSWTSTPLIREFLRTKVQDCLSSGMAFVTEELLGEWMDELKNELKIKGKPLFMGTRVVLTGMAHGPDLKVLVALTPLANIQLRLDRVKG